MTPEQMTALLRELHTVTAPGWYALAAGAFVALVLAAAGGYFAAYLQARGQRKAHSETLNLIERKTEEIKAEVSGGLWLRQKRWDLRGELYADLIRLIDDLGYSGRVMKDADELARARDTSDPAFEEYRRIYDDARTRTLDGLRMFEKGRALGEIFLPSEATVVLDAMRNKWKTALQKHPSPLGIVQEWTDLSMITDKTLTAMIEIAKRDMLSGSMEQQGSP